MKINYYDIGLNLFCRQFPDPQRILDDAAKNGVGCILTGTDTRENKKIHEYLKANDAFGLFGTAGIHPHNADRARQEDFRQIEQILAENPRIVAVGECGLDYDRMFSTKENQIRCLEKHIVLAEKWDKPLFLHERDAADDFMKRLKKHPEICKKSVEHWITGWICDDVRGKVLREAVSILPLDRVLIETDAPYLTPKNVQGLGRVNVPQNIVYVAKELAKWMKVTKEELTESARKNTERIFSI